MSLFLSLSFSLSQQLRFSLFELPSVVKALGKALTASVLVFHWQSPKADSHPSHNSARN